MLKTNQKFIKIFVRFFELRFLNYYNHVKHFSTQRIFNEIGKAIPLQVWSSPKVSRRLSFQDFKTIGT
jgi:hypothetical protein